MLFRKLFPEFGVLFCGSEEVNEQMSQRSLSLMDIWNTWRTAPEALKQRRRKYIRQMLRLKRYLVTWCSTLHIVIDLLDFVQNEMWVVDGNILTEKLLQFCASIEATLLVNSKGWMIFKTFSLD